MLGGDGTMLNIARTFAPYEVALVGVNQGRLGFLTDISLDTMFETIGAILEGEYVTEDRMLLEAEIYSGGERVFNVLAFNDVVVSKGVQRQHDRVRGADRRRADLHPALGRPHRRDAHRLDRVRAVLRRSDRASVLARDGAGAGVPAHAFEPPDRHQQRQHSRNRRRERRRPARALRQPFALRAAAKAIACVVRRYAHNISLLHPVGHSYYAMLRQKLHWNRDS